MNTTAGTKGLTKVNPATCDAAREAGYWLCGGHGRDWQVGKGDGPSSVVFPEYYRSRSEALAAMVAAAEVSRWR